MAMSLTSLCSYRRDGPISGESLPYLTLVFQVHVDTNDSLSNGTPC